MHTTTTPFKNQFEQEGYLRNVPILTDREVQRYRHAYERIEASATRRNQKGRITNMHHEDSDIWALALHPSVLELVEQLIGPDIVLLSTGFFSKPPQSTQQFVDWHQDTTYWGLVPPVAITAWTALDDSNVENGCMRIIPGSHRNGLLPHGISKQDGNVLGQNQAIDVSHFDESTAVDLVLKAGNASFHHGQLIHGSNPNCSAQRRCGMTARYTTPDVKPVKEGPYAFCDRAILLRGTDRFGHFEYADAPKFA